MSEEREPAGVLVPAAPVRTARDVEPRGTRVLVVDDSATVRRAVTSILSAHGLVVTTASDGEEAFERAMREPFDVIVTDLTMGALGGVQLCRLLRSTPETAEIPVVMLTASGDRRMRFWATHAGADVYVEKEAVHTELAGAVARIARPRQARVGPQRPRRVLERLSSLLDDLLFRAVLGSEIHRIVERASEPDALAREIAALAGTVADPPVIVVSVGVPPVAIALLARTPMRSAESVLAQLGVDAGALEVSILGDPAPRHGLLELGEIVAHPLAIGAEVLGELRAAAPARTRIAARDADTLALIARESALVVKATLLAEVARRTARTDALTGVPNRRALEERLEHELRRARRHGRALALALCDVDHFKRVNDTHGHVVGDGVLRAVAHALTRSVRTVDLVGRWGGEEFLAVLPDASDVGARIACERMRMAVEQLPPMPGGPARVTASFGVAAFAPDATTESVLALADAALYRAKQRGRNRVELERAT